MPESDPQNPKVETKRTGGMWDAYNMLTRFIKEVGFPIAVATAFIVYIWLVGLRTNEYMTRGTDIMERVVHVLEKMEKKLDR
jgi:hypothetical protein